MVSTAASAATLTHTEVFKRVSAIVAESMGIDFALQETTRIIEECGADSLDFLDIVFRIEKEFGLSPMARAEFFPEKFLGDRRLITPEGVLRAEGAAYLQKRETWLAQLIGDSAQEGERVRDWYTISLLCRYVEWKLGMP